MQNETDKYLEVKSWSEREFNHTFSFFSEVPELWKELQDHFLDYNQKPISLFSLSEKYKGNDVNAAKSIFLINFLIKFCEKLKENDLNLLNWIKERFNEIQKPARVAVKEKVKKLLYCQPSYWLFGALVAGAYYNAFLAEPYEPPLPFYLYETVCLAGGTYIVNKFGNLLNQAIFSDKFLQEFSHDSFWKLGKSNNTMIEPEVKKIMNELDKIIVEKKRKLLSAEKYLTCNGRKL
jgi:hypothetical protein